MKDETEQLITQLLVRHQAVVPMLTNRLIVIGLLLSFSLALILLAPFGFREQWPLTALLKTLALFSFAFALLRCTQINCQPAEHSYTEYRGVALGVLLGGASLLTLGWQAPEQSLTNALAEPSFWSCIAWIGGVATCCLVGLLRILRRATPLYRWRLILSCSGLAGFLTAAVYSLHCPVDSLSYLSTAYLLALLIVMIIGYALSRRLWHW